MSRTTRPRRLSQRLLMALRIRKAKTQKAEGESEGTRSTPISYLTKPTVHHYYRNNHYYTNNKKNKYKRCLISRDDDFFLLNIEGKVCRHDHYYYFFFLHFS